MKSLFGLIALLAALCAQLPPGTVPVLEEPRHLLKFENKYVRVIDASVPVGDATLFHTHAIDNVPVAISGGKLRTETVGSGTADSTVATGTVSFARGTYTHRIANVGETPLRFIDAEVLASPGGPKDAPSLDGRARHTLVIDNERVRIYRLVLAPGESTGMHTHALSRLSVVVEGGRVEVESDREGRRMENFKPGDFRWRDGKQTHTIENRSTSRFEMIEIEWK